MADIKRTAKSTSAKKAATDTFTPEERTAMRELAQERKAAARRKAGAQDSDPEEEVLAKIAAMPEEDRRIAERIHALVKANAPELSSRLWYGMPAYAKGEKVICYFQNAQKFKTRYATLGFSDKAALDDGDLWPVAFALKKLTPAAEARIAALVKKAVS